VSSSGPLATSRETSEAVLAPDADAPRAARDFAASTLDAWGVPQWGESVGLVVSELVTNAVRHAGTSVALRLIPAGTGVVVVEVDDAAGGEPLLVPAERRTVSGGLGLAIVDRLADDWGYTQHVNGDGKTVWARLHLPDPPPPAGGTEGDVVLLDLPWDKDLVGLVRSTVVHLAVRAGFARRDTEDLRLAADEIFSLLYAQHPQASMQTAITCRFSVAPGMVQLTMRARVAAHHPPGADDYGWPLLQALVDELEWIPGDGECAVRAEKRSAS